jgi:two-component sensor histidine kinase
MPSALDEILRLVVAMLAGTALGFNREWRQKPLGMRTLALVALGSAIAPLAALHFHGLADASPQALARVVQGILEGVLGGIGLRIETIARLHGLLAGAPESGDVDLASYLSDVARIAMASFGERTELSLAPGCVLSQKDAAAVGLVVGEALTNALKYAHSAGITGMIEVGCRQHRDGGIVLEIADDGVGLPVAFDPMASDALGLRLIRSLALQLSARLEFEHPGIGLCVRLVIPPAEATADSST